METKVQRWGNSLAVRIPKPFARHIHLSAGMKAHVNLKNNEIVIQPVSSTKAKLSRLLAAVEPRQLHGEMFTDKPVGRELW